MAISDGDVHHTLWLRELPRHAESDSLAVSCPPGPVRTSVQRVRLFGSLVRCTEAADGSVSCLIDDSTGLCECELASPVAVAARVCTLQLGDAVEVLGEVSIDSTSRAVTVVCVSVQHQPDPMYELLRWTTLLEQRRSSVSSRASAQTQAPRVQALPLPRVEPPTAPPAAGGNNNTVVSLDDFDIPAGLSQQPPTTTSGDMHAECLRIICASGDGGASLDTIVAALAPELKAGHAAVAAILENLEGGFEVYARGGAYVAM